jgi:hypothetical protein
MMMSRIKWLAGAVLAGMSGIAAAVGQVADVTVFDRADNRILPLYHHDGRYFVVGNPGNEYQIRVRNRTGGDVLAVVSVDGVNAVTGETANWEQSGYVLGARQRYDIKGWRKSLQRVAAFFFTQHDNSYAARTGRPDHVGVIGVAVFRRKTEPAVSIPREQAPEPRNASRAESPAGASASNTEDALAGDSAERAAGSSQRHGSPRAPAERKLGTGHGRSESSYVTHTEFDRASSIPDEVIVVHYDTYRNLVAQGVIRAPRVALPTPFPGQFVPDPR